MKRLTLFRHAKSGWDNPALRDFDRPLNDKGRRAARTMGRYMRDQGMRFDRVIASPAARVVETLAAASEGYGRRETAAAWDQRIYLAAPATLMEIVRETPAEVGDLMIAGHNPGLEELALLLVPDTGDAARERMEMKFPTAALVTIGFDVANWPAVQKNGGTLLRFIRPRDLDATLGPDY